MRGGRLEDLLGGCASFGAALPHLDCCGPSERVVSSLGVSAPSWREAPNLGSCIPCGGSCMKLYPSAGGCTLLGGLYLMQGSYTELYPIWESCTHPGEPISHLWGSVPQLRKPYPIWEYHPPSQGAPVHMGVLYSM